MEAWGIADRANGWILGEYSFSHLTLKSLFLIVKPSVRRTEWVVGLDSWSSRDSLHKDKLVLSLSFIFIQSFAKSFCLNFASTETFIFRFSIWSLCSRKKREASNLGNNKVLRVILDRATVFMKAIKVFLLLCVKFKEKSCFYSISGSCELASAWRDVFFHSDVNTAGPHTDVNSELSTPELLI